MSDTESLQSELKLNTTNLTSTKEEHDRTESDSEASIDGGASNANSEEYEEYDLTDNPLYQVLSAFLEDDEGNNLCDHIQNLTEAVKENSNKLDKLLNKEKKTRPNKK